MIRASITKGEDGARFLKIDVIDSGIGIKDDNKEKLFRLFGFVQDSRQMNTSGIGLGLVIADVLV